MNSFKALAQLGFRPVALNALYRFGLATGHYRRVEKKESGEQRVVGKELSPLFILPSRDELLRVLGEAGRVTLLAEAEEIVSGKVRLFGGEPVDLQLSVPGPLAHWTDYETGKADQRSFPFDIKLLWEPARFGWVFTLGRAYHIAQDEKYTEAFWRYFETFTDANPPYLGPHWMSGQEVALRLMAFVWAAQVFAESPSSNSQRKTRLAASVAEHAARIPPTLPYARSQQNNHLLTEAAGLLTAGLALPDAPDAPRWCSLGWRWLNDGLRSQIDSYGEYTQHSTNYHRLMLQVVLWVNAVISNKSFLEHSFGARIYHWPRQTNEALTRSVHWLLSLMDSETGRTPNLGANDGAYIFPLTVSPFGDYRPILHAAARAFLSYELPHGSWDEMALWFNVQSYSPKTIALPRYLGDQLYGENSWVYLRTAQFTSRPSHADQLHVDLWWRGLNVAQDAGTYFYNAPPPWDNSLVAAFVHNTVTVNGRDQMTRAGRFLYLDWFNAYRRRTIETDPAVLQRVRGRHWGYWRLGIRHERTVTAFADGRWQVMDEMLPLRMPWDKKLLTYRLHWLLPDWPCMVDENGLGFMLYLESPYGQVVLAILHNPASAPSTLSLVRAGESLYGSGVPEPIRGWASPTYGVKLPALSLAVTASSVNDVQFVSEFIFL
jgi:hypothetical protein